MPNNYKYRISKKIYLKLIIIKVKVFILNINKINLLDYQKNNI